MERMGAPARKSGVKMAEVLADDAVLVRRIHVVVEAFKLVKQVATVERIELR